MGTKNSKITIQQQRSKVINPNIFDNSLSSIDIVLLSRLMSNIAIFTSNRTVVTMTWKTNHLICSSSTNESRSSTNTTDNSRHRTRDVTRQHSHRDVRHRDKKLKRIINNDGNIDLYIHLLKLSCSIYIKNEYITIYDSNHISKIKRMTDYRADHDIMIRSTLSHRVDIVKMYSGIKINDDTSTMIDYIVIGNDVIIFTHCSSRLMLIEDNDGIYQYHLNTKMLEEVNVSNNVKIALHYILDEYYK